MSVLPEYRITAEPVEASSEGGFGLPFDFLRVDVGHDTNVITDLLNAAVDFGEAYTNRVFRLTSFTALFPCLEVDCSMPIRRPFVEIEPSPFVDVQELRVFEQGNPSATMLVPELARRPDYARLFLPKSFTGILDPDRLYPIEVDFRAGYSTSASPVFPEVRVPQAIKQGLRQHVAYLYENRSDVAGDFTRDNDAHSALPDDVKLSYGAVRIALGAC